MRLVLRVRGVLLGIAIPLSLAEPAHTRTLTDVFRNQRLRALELDVLGPALADTVTSTYPVSSASSSVAYRFDPALDTFRRVPGPLGPLLGERAETIGRGRIDVGVAYSYVRITEINGVELAGIESQRFVGSRFLTFPIPTGCRLQDCRFTNFLPVRASLDLDVEAQIFALNATYGLAPDWDINLYLPLVRSWLRLDVQSEVPDPRFPEFAVGPDCAFDPPPPITEEESAFGIGDLTLRTKYLLGHIEPVNVAAALSLVLPTGSPEDLHGSGDTQVEPLLVLSALFTDRVEPILNLGVTIDADDTDRSAFRWATGLNLKLFDNLSGAVMLFGRHELSAQTEAIENPFFFQIERNDFLDMGFSFRFLADPFVISASALVPLNEQGLRTEVTPTVQIEYLH